MTVEPTEEVLAAARRFVERSGSAEMLASFDWAVERRLLWPRQDYAPPYEDCQ